MRSATASSSARDRWVRVAIESHGAEGLVNRADMVDAYVVRNEGVGGSACVVAVRYADQKAVANAA